MKESIPISEDVGWLGAVGPHVDVEPDLAVVLLGQPQDLLVRRPGVGDRAKRPR